MNNRYFQVFLLCITFAAGAISQPAFAKAKFLGISAGDMTQDSVILWSRVDGATFPAASVDVAKDISFQSVITTVQSDIRPENNNTIKLKVSGLEANTQYFYRFSVSSVKSWTGSFFTNPDPQTPSPFKIAFTGDADQKYRPYPAIEYFGNSMNAGSTGLNAFIYLGDTIYESTANGLLGFGRKTTDVPIPLGTDSATVAVHAMHVLNRRYDANIQGVDPLGLPHDERVTGLNGARSLLAATGVYTLLDNHEIFGALQSGGAPLDAVKENSNPDYAINSVGPYNNDSIAFLAETKAFYNNMPTAVNIDGVIDPAKPANERYGLSFSNLLTPQAPVVKSNDPRGSEKPANYFSRRWGKNIYYIQLDDRSFRDARMAAPARYALTPAKYPLQEARFDSTGKLDPTQAYTSGFQKGDPLPGVFMSANKVKGRTMLGSDQLAWLLAELDKAKATHATWTVIAVSTPIDQRGPLTDSKSWAGGYPAERNVIMKKIVDLGLHNVVFLTADDHSARVNTLNYQPDPENDSNWASVPYAFQILAGPMGAVGPDSAPFSVSKPLKDDFAEVVKQTNETNAELNSFQQPILGLVGYPGLSGVTRLFDDAAATSPTPIDFYTPDTFGYTTLDWDAMGLLTVRFWGIKAYAAETYPKPYSKARKIIEFSVSPG